MLVIFDERKRGRNSQIVSTFIVHLNKGNNVLICYYYSTIFNIFNRDRIMVH